MWHKAPKVALLDNMTVEDLSQLLIDVEAVGLEEFSNNSSIMGISGTRIVVAIAGALGYIQYENFVAGQLKELQKMNYSNITEVEKQNAISQLQQLGIQALNYFNISLRCFNYLNGCINSNITTRQ